ncbi:TonB-dependent receptor [Anditalea andensis]|uniref:TonB-dependent transporter Oar-like beta-barrel domain-containing protein n=1 Tax=Anditalea andensis TaxID=1048983 RepID=A0A074KYE1_9BACT|nr:carboxypeptidase regulatory-like domain-containing protein [Anditalea andensis]KEO73225.1 hypothetical protein EL17_12790 [Anditalea andensis]
MRKNLLKCIFALVFLILGTSSLFAQGVTTASITGVVTDSNNETLPGANVIAVHGPSGSRYGATTRNDGRFTIPGMRVGGPYTITVSYVGFQSQVYDNIDLQLGQIFRLDATMYDEGVDLAGVEIVAQRSNILNDERAGSATNISNEQINALPTISRSIFDFTRLTPQASGNGFAGTDSRFNNLTIDGSIFNNSFGLSSTPAGQTNSTPISLDAIQEIQVNLSPYDVTQGGFTGAGINAITRSGDNEFRGSVFYNNRNNSYVGDNARGNAVITDQFDVNQYGFRLGGPIVKNKLFFFINAESERRSDPNSQFIAAPGEGANVTRVLRSDYQQLSQYMLENYGYETGAFENYSLRTQSDKLLAKIDYNISRNHKLSVRYNQLISLRDVPASNSSSFQNRRDNLFSLNAQATNYIINNDIYSGIAELNSTFGSRFSNRLLVGYTANRDYRGSTGGIFPLVDILQEGRNYLSFGYEPFSPNNRLDTDTWQVQNNFTAYLDNHTITGGVNFESFEFTNGFTPQFYGQYTFNSLQDFYAASDQYLAGTPQNVPLRRYQLTYSALEGGAIPFAVTKAYQIGAYVQDEYSPTRNLKLTGGVRIDVPFFDNTALNNPEVEQLNFQNPSRNNISLSTSQLPEPAVMFSPRLGFNWDVIGDRSIQLRGGTGVFTGRPAFVWISNQVGNNGILTGSIFEDNVNTARYPFSPDVTANIPANATTPSQYAINATEREFKWPQNWRSNIAVDAQLPGGFVGTLEYIYTQNLNNVIYYDANLNTPVGNLVGPDNRPYYASTTGSAANNERRINNNINNAYVLGNYGDGFAHNITAQIQKQFTRNLFFSAAYNYSVAKDLVSLGSTASSSYNGGRTITDNNNLPLSISDNEQRHRAIASISYRKEYSNGATQVSAFWEARNLGRRTYTYNGDVNRDGIAGNSLIFVPTPEQLQEMTFLPITAGDFTYTEAMQRTTFDQYIQADPYLRTIRGQYAERNGGINPFVARMDFTLVQEFFINIGDKRNTLQFRADVINFGNLLSNTWGVARVPNNTSMITISSISPEGVPVYQMQRTNNVLRTDIFRDSATLNDVWQLQLGVRYIFN